MKGEGEENMSKAVAKKNKLTKWVILLRAFCITFKCRNRPFL